MRALPIVRLVFANSHAQPSGRAEFDVASIRPSAAAGGGPITVGCNVGPGTRDRSLFTCQNMTLSNLGQGVGFGPQRSACGCCGPSAPDPALR
jgi:hypothetical protein